jgi:hypothetical protein
MRVLTGSDVISPSATLAAWTKMTNMTKITKMM